MQKKLIAVFGLLVAMMMFSGCMDVRLGFTLKQDGTGGMNVAMAVNQSLMGEEETTGMESEFFDSTQMDDMNAQMEMIPLEYYKDDMLFVGEEYTITFEDALIAFSEIAQTEDLSWTYQGDGVYRFEIPLSEVNEEVANEEMDDMSTMFKAMGGAFVYSFETDFEVIDHNADDVDGDVYTWDFTEEIFAEAPERQFGFLEVRVEIAPSENPLRRELEESLDLDLTSRDYHGEALEAMGYLKGTELGLELDRELTRTEGAIMYSRLLGLEDEIKAFAQENPNYESGFSDVPAWAEDTINYLQHMGLVNGISDTLYGASAQMTEAQYTTLVLRALGYSDRDGDFVWNASIEKAIEEGLYADDVRAYAYTENSSDMFTRRMMSYISYNALFYENIDTQEMLFDAIEE